jgi:hypothetical protein
MFVRPLQNRNKKNQRPTYNELAYRLGSADGRYFLSYYSFLGHPDMPQTDCDTVTLQSRKRLPGMVTGL